MVSSADASLLEGLLDAFTETTMVAEAEPIVTELLTLSDARPWEAERSFWTWLTAWSTTTRQDDEYVLAAKIMMFAKEWHDAFVPASGRAWMSLMTAEDTQLVTVQTNGIAACGALPAGTVLRFDGVTAGAVLGSETPRPQRRPEPTSRVKNDAPPVSKVSTRWLTEGEQAYQDQIGRYYGSPETIAVGGTTAVRDGDIAAALFFFQKSIDLLHTLYVVRDMERRGPSELDEAILQSYLRTLKSVLGSHPDAPVNDSVREVTHRLRTISTRCQHNGVDATRYLDALDDLGEVASHVDIENILWQN